MVLDYVRVRRGVRNWISQCRIRQKQKKKLVKYDDLVKQYGDSEKKTEKFKLEPAQNHLGVTFTRASFSDRFLRIKYGKRPAYEITRTSKHEGDKPESAIFELCDNFQLKKRWWKLVPHTAWLRINGDLTQVKKKYPVKNRLTKEGQIGNSTKFSEWQKVEEDFRIEDAQKPYPNPFKGAKFRLVEIQSGYLYLELEFEKIEGNRGTPRDLMVSLLAKRGLRDTDVSLKFVSDTDGSLGRIEWGKINGFGRWKIKDLYYRLFGQGLDIISNRCSEKREKLDTCSFMYIYPRLNEVYSFVVKPASGYGGGEEDTDRNTCVINAIVVAPIIILISVLLTGLLLLVKSLIATRQTQVEIENFPGP